jgi:hypothetical protein
MCFKWGCGVVGAEKAVEQVAVTEALGSELAEIMRTNVLDKAIGQASEIAGSKQ